MISCRSVSSALTKAPPRRPSATRRDGSRSRSGWRRCERRYASRRIERDVPGVIAELAFERMEKVARAGCRDLHGGPVEGDRLHTRAGEFVHGHPLARVEHERAQERAQRRLQRVPRTRPSAGSPDRRDGRPRSRPTGDAHPRAPPRDRRRASGAAPRCARRKRARGPGEPPLRPRPHTVLVGLREGDLVGAQQRLAFLAQARRSASTSRSGTRGSAAGRGWTGATPAACRPWPASPSGAWRAQQWRASAPCGAPAPPARRPAAGPPRRRGERRPAGRRGAWARSGTNSSSFRPTELRERDHGLGRLFSGESTA